MITELLSQAGQWILTHPAEAVSFTVTGAAVTSFLLRKFITGAKWDNKLYRFILDVADVISLDSRAEEIIKTLRKYDGVEDEKKNS